MSKRFFTAGIVLAGVAMSVLFSCSSSHRRSASAADEIDSTVVDSVPAGDDLFAEDDSEADRPNTGTSVYQNDDELGTEEESIIKVSTPSDGVDHILIVKRAGLMVANVYIRTGSTYQLYLPNGEYEVFFYSGTRWNPKKRVGRHRGAFKKGYLMKDDDELELFDQKVSYSLARSENGNFELSPCDEDEVFD